VSLGEWIPTFLSHYNPSECWELPAQKFQSTTLLLQCQISKGNIHFIWNSNQWRWSSQICPNIYTSCTMHHCKKKCAKRWWVSTLSRTNTTIPIWKYGHKHIPSGYLKFKFLIQQMFIPETKYGCWSHKCKHIKMPNLQH